jgi:hypothetical protein
MWYVTFASEFQVTFDCLAHLPLSLSVAGTENQQQALARGWSAAHKLEKPGLYQVRTNTCQFRATGGC